MAHNVLSHSQNYRLTQWLDYNKEKVEELSNIDVAKAAADELGFQVTLHNIISSSRVIGIRQSKIKKPEESLSKLWQSMESTLLFLEVTEKSLHELENVTKKQEKEIFVLQVEVAKLMQRLPHVPNPDQKPTFIDVFAPSPIKLNLQGAL